MKAIRQKLEKELRMLEEREYNRMDQDIDRGTIETVYKLSKALVYLHKACEIMGAGKSPEKTVATPVEDERPLDKPAETAQEPDTASSMYP